MRGRPPEDSLKSLVLLAMAWAESGNADSDEKPGVIGVQISLCHDVVRDVTRLPTLIKFVADLMTGGDRGLPGREGESRPMNNNVLRTRQLRDASSRCCGAKTAARRTG